MTKKSYTAPHSEVIAIDTIMPIAASGVVNDSEDNGKYEYIDKASGKYYFAKFAAEDGTGEFSVMFSVPEPSTWAAIFGALALAFAIYRRRK